MASVHPVLEKHGWKYHALHVWDKGIGHIAGNALGKLTQACFLPLTQPEY